MCQTTSPATMTTSASLTFNVSRPQSWKWVAMAAPVAARTPIATSVPHPNRRAIARTRVRSESPRRTGTTATASSSWPPTKNAMATRCSHRMPSQARPWALKLRLTAQGGRRDGARAGISRSGRRTRPRGELHLAMAIGAPEHALLCLLAVGLERAPVAHVHRECLRRRIDVMKVEVGRAPVVATRRTASAGLIQQRCPHEAVARRDPLADATAALPPVALAVADPVERCEAVAGAFAPFGRGGQRPGPASLDAASIRLSHERMFVRAPDTSECPRRDS